MKCIVAVDANNAIGRYNQLLFKIPEDHKFFKETTINHAVVMGRKTYDSIGKPLSQRTNLIITRDNRDTSTDVVIGDKERIDALIKSIESNGEKVFIIGGESIYEQYIDKCDELFITQYFRAYASTDAFFPNPDTHGFKLNKIIERGTYEGFEYEIQSWVKK